MTATLMDGRALAAKVRAGVAQEVQGLGQLGLATVLVGDDPASHGYVASKHRAASEAGIEPHDHTLPADTSEEDLLELVTELNGDDSSRSSSLVSAGSLWSCGSIPASEAALCLLA